MRYTSNGTAAVLAICLAVLPSASAFAEGGVVNDENDARSFAVREGELARERAGAPGQVESVKAETAKAATAKAEVASAVAGDEAGTSAKPGKESRRIARGISAPAGSDGLKAIVARHAAANGVPFSLADAVVRVESRYNPRAANAGNYGLMQIRHQTARGVGYTGSAGGLLDAETNARYGMKYLAMAYKLAGGDTCRTVMKYQSGHMAVRMNGANRAYCAKVRTISARN